MFHEAHLVEDVCRYMTNSNLHEGSNTQIHHELIRTSKSKSFNKVVKETWDVSSQQGNIFNVLNFVSLTNETENLDFTNKCTPRGKHPKRRKIDIAKAKDEKIFDILKYNLSENNMLYDGSIMAEADKSKIVAKIEEYLPNPQEPLQ